MILNIYYSSKFQKIKEFQEFFTKNYLFNDQNDYLAGQLLDIYFFDIEKYVQNEGASIILIDDFLIDAIYNNDIQIQLLNDWKFSQKILFVALSKNFNQLKLAQEINFIRPFDKDNIFQFLLTEITHDILRFLLGEEKINIFISHIKQDGREIAKSIKNFIDSDVKLGNFFDEIDIQNSTKWDRVLKDKVENSLFLYILSDTYANTLWTKKELILAKQNNIPIIGIDVIKNKNNSVSLFVSNTKLCKLINNVKNIEVNCNDSYILQTHSNIREVITNLLIEALKFYILKQNHKDILIRKPDLFDLCNAKGNIFYPEPPLINIEKETLEKCSNHKISTPLTKNLKKMNKNIAISISESQNLEEKGLSQYHLKMAMIEIARYLIIQGNTLIYGGDLGYKKEFNFTQILANLFRSYNNIFETEQKLINYSARPFCEKVDIEIKNSVRDVIYFKDCIGEKCDFDDRGQITKNLTQIRKEITDNMDIKIAIGGKIIGFMGIYPGVLEEVYLALQHNKKVILIDGFGGIVDEIVKLINNTNIDTLTFEYQMQNHIKLRNYLEKNEKLKKEVKSYYENMIKTILDKKEYLIVINLDTFNHLIDNVLKELK